MDHNNRENSIYLFKKEDFFSPNENVYIHMSSEFPDYVGVIHKHSFIEIVYIISGHATHYLSNSYYNAQKGDLFIINYEEPHGFFVDTKVKEPFQAYDLMFTPDFLDSSVLGQNTLEALDSSYLFNSIISINNPNANPFPPLLSVTGESYNYFGELFNRIYLEYKSHQKGYQEMIRALLIEILVTIYRKRSSFTNSTADGSKSYVNFALSYIHDHYAEHITAEALSNNVNLSKSYFSRLFHDTTGFTITEMIHKIRIENACRLLSTTNRTIYDIAFSCGFENIKSFYTAFKKIMKMLPNEYRSKTLNEVTVFHS